MHCFKLCWCVGGDGWEAGGEGVVRYCCEGIVKSPGVEVYEGLGVPTGGECCGRIRRRAWTLFIFFGGGGRHGLCYLKAIDGELSVLS